MTPAFIRHLDPLAPRAIRFPVLLLAATVLAFFPATAFGQDAGVIGTVTSPTGELLEGIAVTILGTELGALTDARGQYRLTVPTGRYTIRASGLGRSVEEQEVMVAAGQFATANFVLAEEAIELEEVLVSLAATEARRIQFGTDVASVDVAQELDYAAVTSFSDMMNSRVAGITIAETSGQVGTASKVRIRGATSLTQDNNPIVYVDGIRVSNATGAGPQAIDLGDGATISRLDDLNPADIANIQVMKGPTAAAAYGSEAAAGVIIITTRRGVAGEPEFRLSTEVGASQNVASFPDNYFNLTEYGGFTDAGDPLIQQFRPVQNPATGDIFARHNPLEADNPFRTGMAYKSHLSVQGGTQDIQYYGSASYENEGGALPNNESEQISFRGNFSATLTDAIDLAFSSSYMNTRVRTGGSGRSGTSIVLNGLLGLPQFGYGRNPDGSRGDCLATIVFGDPESVCEERHGNYFARWDKVATVLNQHEAHRFIGSVQLNVRPTSWFSNRLVVGTDLISSQDLNILPLDPDRPFGDRSRGEVDDVRHVERILSFDYAGTVVARLTDALSTTTTLGVQYFGRKRESLGCEGRGGFPGPNAIACSVSLTYETSTSVAEIVELGTFLQETVGWNEYLFATGAMRVDDNSGVGKNQGAIFSPSVNASIVLSRMPFWTLGLFDDLRLRFAWGNAAQAPGPFDAITTFEPVRLDRDGQQVAGISPNDPGNPNLKPERKEEYEAGFDASFLNERVSLQFTYFWQNVTDAIIDRRVSPGTGFSGQQYVNIGRVENQGLEGLLNVRIMEREGLAWDASLNVSTEDPIITDMGGLEPITGFFQMSGMFHEGYAPGAYYGPMYVDAERDENGDIVPGSVVLAPGNLDFASNPNYRYLGRPNPTNQQTLSSSLTLYNRITLSALFNRRAGHKRMDTSQGRRNCFIPNRSGGRLCAFREALLSPAEQAALEEREADAPMLFLHDADFIKLRELTLHYVLPPALTTAVPGIETAAITLGGRNLLTWTDFPGFDPEADVSGGVDGFGNSGIYGNLGPSRMFFGRLTVTF